MGKLILQKSGGGGLDPDELTAQPGDVIKGKIAGVAGSDEPAAGTLELTGTAADSQVLTGQTYYNTDAKNKRTGSMPNRGAWTGRVGINGTVAVPAGYHNGAGYVDQSVTNRGAWTGSVAMNGKVTVPEGYHSGGGYVNGPAVTQRGAWATSIGVNGRAAIPEGYHNGSGYVNQSIATSGGWTVTPQTSAQSCGISGKYMTSDMTVAGVALPPANAIKKGYRYWIGSNYVDGIYEGYVTNPLFFYNRGTWSNLQTTGLTSMANNYLITEKSDYLNFAGKINSNGSTIAAFPGAIIVCRLNQIIDLTAYKYLKLELHSSSESTTKYIGISTSAGVSNKSFEKSSALKINSGIIILDISNIAGSKYIYFANENTTDKPSGLAMNMSSIILSNT